MPELRTAFSAQTETPLEREQRQLQAAKELAGNWDRDEEHPPEPRWGPPAPTPKALLAIPRNPISGAPVEEPPPADRPEEPWAEAQRLKRNIKLFKDWLSLDERERTQIVVDLTFGAEPGPRWDVAVPLDPSQPRLLVPAPAAHVAEKRYLDICGIRGMDAPVRAVATPYVAPASNGNGTPKPSPTASAK